MSKIIKNIIKYFVILIIVALNVIIWGRIFVSCDAPLAKKILTDAKTAEDMKQNPTSYTINEYFPAITMDELGKVQLRYVTHIVESDDLQFTVKYNIKYFEGKTPLEFVLRHKAGEEEHTFTDYYALGVDRYAFRYMRFTYKDLKFSKDDSIYLDVYTAQKELFCTINLISPEISNMQVKTVGVKTQIKK